MAQRARWRKLPLATFVSQSGIRTQNNDDMEGVFNSLFDLGSQFIITAQIARIDPDRNTKFFQGLTQLGNKDVVGASMGDENRLGLHILPLLQNPRSVWQRKAIMAKVKWSCSHAQAPPGYTE